MDNRLLSFYAFAPKSAQSLLENIKLDNTNKTISFDYEVPNGTVSEGDENDAEVQPDIMLAITECNKTTSADGKVPMNFRHALSAIKFAIRDVVELLNKSPLLVFRERHIAYIPRLKQWIILYGLNTAKQKTNIPKHSTIKRLIKLRKMMWSSIHRCPQKPS